MLIISNGKIIKEPSDCDVINNVARSALGVIEMLGHSNNHNDNECIILNHEPIGRCHCEVCERIRTREKTSIRIPEEEYNNMIRTIEDLKKKNKDLLVAVNNAYSKIGSIDIARQSIKNEINKIEKSQLESIINYMNSPEMVNELYRLRSSNRDMIEKLTKCNAELELVKLNKQFEDCDEENKIIPLLDNRDEIPVSKEVEEILSKYYNYLKNLLSSSTYSSKTSSVIKDGSIGICIYFNNKFIEESSNQVEAEINAGNGYFGIIIRYDENNDNFISRSGVIIEPEEIEYYIALPQEIQDLFIS